MQQIKRALLSVYNKEGIVSLARDLEQRGVEILSTGGTYALLKKEGIAARPVEDLTRFPEMMDGRVKTLHPAIHGGLLAVREEPRHLQQMQENGILPIDLAVINLYPFESVIQKKGVTLEEAVENIDIGGPAMLRSAAKNFKYVTAVCDPADYGKVLEELKGQGGCLSEIMRSYLALKVFQLTSRYDQAIASFLEEKLSSGEKTIFPMYFCPSYERVSFLRYGENPHQQAALYRRHSPSMKEPFQQLHGKEMSYNNFLDFYASLNVLQEFSNPAVCVIKHTNPCGIAEKLDLTEALTCAIDSDPLSAFGGIIGLNRKCTIHEVHVLFKKINFIEIIIAPSFTQDALKLLCKKKNLRILKIPPSQISPTSQAKNILFLKNTLLMQTDDQAVRAYGKKLHKALHVPTRRKPSQEDIEELLFAWKCAKVVKSNAIVITKSHQTIGIGAGQMSRVGAMEIACRQAGKNAKGAYVASDGFFPMEDNIERAASARIRAIIQPGGSVRDAEVIATADRFRLVMVFTGRRHFKH